MDTLNITPSVARQEKDVDEKQASGNKMFYIGFVMLMTSFALYGLCEYLDIRDNFFMIFCFHYLAAIAYVIVLIIGKSFGIRRSWQRENLGKTAILANLVLISAYALNRELIVFADSTDWFCVYLLLSSITLFSFSLYDKLPRTVNKIQWLLLGSGSVLYLYLALYVANFYVLGGVGVLAFGIGGHVFVPIFLLVLSIVFFNEYKNNNGAKYWYVAGLLIPVFVTAGFMIEWSMRIKRIEKAANQSVIFNNADLPVWIRIAQEIKNDWISERILKEGLVYVTANKDFLNWSFMPKTLSWDEVKKHDPLVFLASLNKKSSLSDAERVSILKAISNGRHRSNERLWSGDNLTTSYIVTDVDIYPNLRLAYTEKYFNVRNNSANGSWWGNREEGIYTFYLPEGSVVTSLSLWIDGKEQKGILTSKQKAAKAYNTIVGVQMRDPSVIHWQEGNTVSVRVFPCTVSEERKFKIGITSPLRKEHGRAYYEDIAFDGPNPNEATETTRIRFIGAPDDLRMTGSFERNNKGDYISEHSYDPDLQISFTTQSLASNQFTFDGFTYALKDYQPSYVAVDFRDVYLDINNTWNESELTALKSLLGSYALYAFVDDERIKLDHDNWEVVILHAREKNFSLFPFNKIANAATSLVVTKGKIFSPHLSDLKESPFAESIAKLFSTGKKIHVFNLEGGSSTYINSLREFRGLEFAKGDSQGLLKLLAEKKFPTVEETDTQVVLHDSQMIITRTPQQTGDAVNNAPDHLARLYFYNDIMRKVGAHYYNDDYINESLVDEASTAYVVSPVSGLIVLETAEDYKKFDINDKDNSLHNASKQSSGAVPEPHEWVLIVLFALMVLYFKFKQ